MTDLERRALMGDKQAQEECTAKGIVLPCPCCGGQAKMKKGFPNRQMAHCRQAVVQCKKCGVRTGIYMQLPMGYRQDVDKMALKTWNSRASIAFDNCYTCRYCVGDGYIHCTNKKRMSDIKDYGVRMCCSRHEPEEGS